MSDNAVFSKLSRILETHAFTTDDRAIDKMIHDYLNDDDEEDSGLPMSPSKSLNNSPHKSSPTKEGYVSILVCGYIWI